MTGQALLAARKQCGLSQMSAAALVGLSQPMLSQMEQGNRKVSTKVALWAVNAFHAEPTCLPLTAERHKDAQLAADLGSLEYPGFAYLSGQPRNPAELLFDALDRRDLDSRVAEGLPWLPLRYPRLDWIWLNREMKLRNRQNRLGFVVALSLVMANRLSNADVADSLSPVLTELEDARLAKADTLCQESWPPARREFVHRVRPPLAAHWNLDTRFSEADLAHYTA